MGRTMQNDVDRLDGVAIGVLLGFSETGDPLVVFAGNRQEDAVPARTTTALTTRDLGREVALLFEHGNAAQPVVIGRLLRPSEAIQTAEVLKDGERLEITAEREVVLRCGKASITLTREGKVLIRGAYISSWSSGAHRIKGGSVHLN
jgi:hypothetical protein